MAHISIMVDHATTFQALKHSLKNEVKSGAVAGYVPHDVTGSARWYDAAMKAIDEMQVNDSFPGILSPYDGDLDCDHDMAFVVFQVED